MVGVQVAEGGYGLRCVYILSLTRLSAHRTSSGFLTSYRSSHVHDPQRIATHTMNAQQHSTAQYPPQLSSTEPSRSDDGSGSPPIDHVTAPAQVASPAEEQEGKDVDVVELSHADTHLHPNIVAPRRNEPIYRTPAFSGRSSLLSRVRSVSFNLRDADLGEYNLADWARDRIDRHYAQIRDEKMRAQMEAQREEERLRKEKAKLDVQDGSDAGSSEGQGSVKEGNDSEPWEVDSSSV